VPNAPSDVETARLTSTETSAAQTIARPVRSPELPGELGGPQGPEPTRFGDWERNGRCIDF